MTIFVLAKLLGIMLILSGFLCMRMQEIHQNYVYRFLRNNSSGYVLFAVASIWFLLKLSKLGEADFGSYKVWLIGLFSFTFIGLAIYWKDFLIVRALSFLSLMGIQSMLHIGYMSSALVRPYLSAFFYLFIIIALFLGVYPYWARDIIPTLFKKNARWLKLLGLISIIYGLTLISLSFCTHA